MTWNVNGIRAVQRKGFSEWLAQVRPDILCIQETKAQPDQVPEEISSLDGYQSEWVSAERKGYSGVGTLYRTAPVNTRRLDVDEFDVEGRTAVLDFDAFVLFNCYFPNTQEGGRRLDYKLRFCEAVLKQCDELRKQGRHVVIAGDYNIAHTEIDLANPKGNEKNPGFLPEERAWMDRFTEAGYVDTFRMFCTEGGHYTWWTYRFGARAKNVGWRIDYHCVNEELRAAVQQAPILSEVMGSDHCPVKLDLDLEKA
jgi:exodeoxyribonuclease-3